MLRPRQQRILPFWGASFFLFIFGIFYSVQASEYLPQDPKKKSWYISALKVTYDNKKNLYIAEKEVVITGGKTRLEADYVEFSNLTKDALAKGNVLLISGGDSIACNSMEINLATETGIIHKGTIYIQKNNFYINGENIRKTGKFTYSADKGTITSCSGGSPDWKITGSDIKVAVEGYGSAKHATLWAKKIPAAYTPFLTFPIKTQRQSGLLTPIYSPSERKGHQVELPLYFATSRDTDVTFYIDYMEERGVKTGAEFRYILNNKSKGSMFFDYLEDQKTDDGTSATTNYSYSTTPQRTNSDRWWFRMKHNQDLPNGFKAMVDIDFVSDSDYLHEFKDGYSGYDETKAAFEQNFGRSIDEYDDTIRENKLNINKNWSESNLNMSFLWYDNVIARREDLGDTTLQILPRFEFDIIKNQISSLNVYFDFGSEFRSFYRQDTTDTLVNGQRADVYPRLYTPIKLRKSFLFEPSVGARGTVWHTDNFQDINGNSDDFRYRGIYDIGAVLSTRFTKIFSAVTPFANKTKHEIIPKLKYAFVPNVIQNDLPLFDELDRIEEENAVTWSVINRFTKRKSIKTKQGNEHYQYTEFAWIKIFQIFDIARERDNSSEPFSDISLESEINPNPYISLDTDVDWSPYDYHFNAMNFNTTLRDNRGDSISAEYRYSSDTSEFLYTRVDARLTKEIAVYCSYEKDLKADKRVETQTGLEFKRSCWSIRLAYSDSPDEKKVAFLINLYGIGDLGTK
jgi:LPS-assembly protein